MRRDPRAYLWDALTAADAIVAFTQGKTSADYAEDLLLRSGVERQLGLMGEALNQLVRYDSETAEHVPDHRQIIAFRNILGYEVLDDQRVWDVLQHDLPALRGALARLLNEA